MGLYSNNNGSLELLSGATNFSDAPIGAIYPYAGTTIPASFMLCDGTELLRTEYPALFAVIGTSFGTPSDDTKFKLPDLRGEFLRGAGTNSHSGQGSGGTVGTHQNATYVPDIYVAAGGTVLVTPNVDSTFSGQDAQSSLTTGYKTVTLSSGSTTSIPKTYATRPTNTSVNFIIKALEIALPIDFEDAVDNKIANVLNNKVLIAETLYQASSVPTAHANGAQLSFGTKHALDYDFLEIFWTSSSTGSRFGSNRINIVSGITEYVVALADLWTNTSGGGLQGRVVTITDTKLTSSAPMGMNIFPAGSSASQNNYFCSPYKVVGYKYVNLT